MVVTSELCGPSELLSPHVRALGCTQLVLHGCNSGVFHDMESNGEHVLNDFDCVPSSSDGDDDEEEEEEEEEDFDGDLFKDGELS